MKWLGLEWIFIHFVWLYRSCLLHKWRLQVSRRESKTVESWNVETLSLDQVCVHSSTEKRQRRGFHKQPVPTMAAATSLQSTAQVWLLCMCLHVQEACTRFWRMCVLLMTFLQRVRKPKANSTVGCTLCNSSSSSLAAPDWKLGGFGL